MEEIISVKSDEMSTSPPIGDNAPSSVGDVAIDDQQSIRKCSTPQKSQELQETFLDLFSIAVKNGDTILVEVLKVKDSPLKNRSSCVRVMPERNRNSWRTLFIEKRRP
ncbi:hypothetical protein ILUMI_12781 [Ignelater luminosus]|uniref:Uncharacterized protein n=1 Tax=Ignelater luminosus TaxID=2038154 RepID=A0A8K0CXX3_IGNLU|nr:hypothetical protein ILUMI_12781 [Ignelater luminosus]